MTGTLSGLDLVNELEIAASARGLSVQAFVAPLAVDRTKFIWQLRRAGEPMENTVRRVRALIAGEPIPPHSRQPANGRASSDVRDEIARRRALSEHAIEHRRPGETMLAALRRVEAELMPA